MSNRDIKAIKDIPLGAAIKVARKVKDINEAMREVDFFFFFDFFEFDSFFVKAEEFRGAGVQLGKSILDNSTLPEIKSNVTLLKTKKQDKGRFAPLDAKVELGDKDLYGDEEEGSSKMREQVRGGKRRPTITLLPEEVQSVREGISNNHGEASHDSSEAVVGTNFFEVFGLSETSKSGLEEQKKKVDHEAEPSEEKEKDVMNMQLDPNTGKLMVTSGSFSDILDCVIFYVNIQESFVSDLLFVHEYFTTTTNLLNGLKAHFLNTVKVSSEAKTGKLLLCFKQRLC